MDKVVKNYIEEYFLIGQGRIAKAEGTILSTTISIWREVAVKKIRRLSDKHKLPLDKMMHSFSLAVDLDFLEKRLRPEVVKRYKTCILTDHKYLPDKILPKIDSF